MDSTRRNPAFPRMISDYVRLRGAPVLPPRAVEQLREYLVDLFRRGQPPPNRGRGIDWAALADDAGIEPELIEVARKALAPGIEALRRELRKPPIRPARELKHESLRNVRPPPGPTPAALTRRAAAVLAPPTPSREEDSPPPRRRRRRFARAPVIEFPPAVETIWDDIPAFHEALALHMRRHRDTSRSLRRALEAKGHAIHDSTFRMWRLGIKAPHHRDSFAILRCLEARWRLPAGYFKGKLPHPSRAVKGHALSGIGTAERRRLAWHLPDDFGRRPFEEQEEILEWVRRVVVSGATDYRRYQAAAAKQPFGVRFPRFQGVRASVGTRFDDDGAPLGAALAPPGLSRELESLIAFKTATLTPVGYRRRGVWGAETAAQKIEHFGLLFGALAASPRGAVRGRGAPMDALSFGLFAFPGVWDWYLGWREQRRGFFTAWEEDMLSIAAGLTSPETGWLTQTSSLADSLMPIDGLVSEAEIEAARADWPAACARLHRFAITRAKEIARVSRVHHDPFEPILPVLEADSPVGEYRKIAEEIVRLRACSGRYPRAAAENVRSFLLIRLGLHLGFRQKNLRQLLVCPRGASPRSERQLVDVRRGELRWSARDHGWEVFVPACAFKNSGSTFFGGRPFRLLLPDIAGLHEEIDRYLMQHRGVLLGRASDPGTFFVKTAKRSSTDAAYDQTTFFEAWRWTIQRYGIFNPWTGRGAIPGLLPHGPHSVRDVLATHILKQTGSFEQASYAIQDTPETVAQHYGRFLPQDKAAIAAQVINRAWETA